jgi:hypothetical protein
MDIKKLKFVFLFFGVFSTNFLFSQQTDKQGNDETLQLGIDILKRYFYGDNEWYIAKPSVAKDVKGLINFIENDPIDTTINNLNKSFNTGETYVFRLPENVGDSLMVPGFYPSSELSKRIESETGKMRADFEKNKPRISVDWTPEMEEKLNLIPPGKGSILFANGIYKFPKEYVIPEVIPDSVLNSPDEFNKLVKTDSLRQVYIEQKRQFYNDSIVSRYVDSVGVAQQKKELEREINYQVKRLTDSVKVNNYNVLRDYNEKVVQSVNDSISAILLSLADYAGYIDSSQISILNYTGSRKDILLKNGNEYYTRIWLKNIQNDSLSVIVKSTDKKTISMLIDDGVSFSRYKPKETKEFDFRKMEKSISSLNSVGNAYKVETPWIIGGDGHIGFSQTFLSNWEKGGQSAIASLIVLKGFANYTRPDGHIKWENSGELRNGWVYQGGDQSELQKNDDKFEVTSRFGISAYKNKKWFYSGEFNFNTQLFNAYKYPKADNPVPYSAFLAPSRTFFKLGMEYKPNKEFSLLLSPLTVKNVFVRDTSLIDQTRFGIEENRKSFWEPGMNADLYFKKNITEDFSYETKYKMFLNYKEPFKKQDINWENTVNFKLNEFITMRFLLHLIYDDDVKFAVYDENNVKIDEKTKLQVKEYFSIGFQYKINHKVMHSKRLR